MMALFSDCQIVLELTGFSFKKKTEVKKKVTENGGVISYCLTKKATHLVVCNEAEKADNSYKCKMAVKYGVPVVSLDFIHDCVQQGKLLSSENYSIFSRKESKTTISDEPSFKKTRSGGLCSGKILAVKDKNIPKKKTKFDPKKTYMQSWVYTHKSAPPFDEENHQVAKFALFKSVDGKSFSCIEVHVGATVDETDVESCRYRVFYYYNNTFQSSGYQVPVQKCYYHKTVEDALEVYAFLYNQQMGPPNHKKVFYEPVPRNVGSPKFQQMVEEYALDTKPLSAKVVELIEHIWKEATGEIEKEISSSLQSIKLEQVEKAEAILLKLRDATDNRQRTDLVSEFYTSLPHRNKHMPEDKEMRSWLSKKQDVCQMIKDMVSVSEATNWSTRSSTEAKYRALRCRIEDLHTTEQEYQLIKHHVIESLKENDDMTIENIYCVRRQVELANFRKDLKPQLLLFHASKVQNFVGILSRGLLLPKIVVDDHGGTRTDAGMLGNGIYFASSASTSIQYSDESKHKGTRMMLVSNVALGKCKDYTEHHKDLQGPPEGFNSCHGVASIKTEPSQFKDDEYVVYDARQQMIQYLVEFSVEGDRKGSLVIEESSMEEKTDEAEHKEKVDISDVTNLEDPLKKVKAGLVSTSGEVCTMRAVHVRAKLMDLAAKVVVLQEYHNTSSSTIEAKYVFPLDDMAAVCGFEAFINGKHIVGEVKEKETAHKEYEKAISEGHGAYLMDQDEETPEVFTVSVGNLPPGCVVLIKITYVAELQVDCQEHIVFMLPGSVAPWKGDNSTIQQDCETSSVQVSIQMPFDIKDVLCPTHSIRKKVTASNYTVELDDKMSTNLSDGFLLLVSLTEIHVPRMWVEVDEEGNQSEAAMLTFYPEFEVAEDNEMEVILVLDLSNSMKGKALTEAKKVLWLVLNHLPDTTRFNIVVFGTSYRELFPKSETNSNSTQTKAYEFIQNIQANMGSTEVYRPLHSFFLLKLEASLRNVFLVSDGHINNEETTLKSVHENCHHTRIFTFGVSSTHNKHVLKAVSRLGAGSYEYFDSHAKSKWEGKVKSQIHKASQPVLTSVSVAWQQYSDPPPIQAPQQITALFNGSRLVVYGFINNCKMATLKAEIGGQEISTVVSTSELSQTRGKVLHCMTAKAIIRDWEDGVLSTDSIHHQMKKMDMKDYIIELSKKYSIVTQLTSFIAVEKREKDEVFPTDGPSIKHLIHDEDVDSLPYVSWQEETTDEGAQYTSSEDEDEDQMSSTDYSDYNSSEWECEEEEGQKGSKRVKTKTSDLSSDDEQREEFKEAFNLFAKDSGGIQYKDLHSAMRSMGLNSTESEMADIMKEMNVSGNDVVNFNQFLSLGKNRMKDTDAEEDIIEAFAVFDKDGTGHIKQEELLHIMSNLGETITKEETAEMMQDLGGESGMVNYRAFCRSMMEKTDVPREAIGHGSHGELISIESETMYEAASTESESEPEMDFDLFDMDMGTFDETECAKATKESESESDEEVGFGLFEDDSYDTYEPPVAKALKATANSDSESLSEDDLALLHEFEKAELKTMEPVPQMACVSSENVPTLQSSVPQSDLEIKTKYSPISRKCTSQPLPPPPKTGFQPLSKKTHGNTGPTQPLSSRKCHGGLVELEQVTRGGPTFISAAPPASPLSSQIAPELKPFAASPPMSPQLARTSSFLALPSPAIMVSKASPERNRAVRLSVAEKNKKSACMGTPDLGYLSGIEQSPYLQFDHSPSDLPASTKPSTFGKKLSKSAAEPHIGVAKVSKPEPNIPTQQSFGMSLTPSSSLSVPQQQMSRITPTHPLPLQTEDTPPGAPRPRQRSRRLSEEQSFFAEKLRSSEARRLSIDLSEQLLTERRKQSSYSEELDECMSGVFKDLSCDVNDSLDDIMNGMMPYEEQKESTQKPRRKRKGRRLRPMMNKGELERAEICNTSDSQLCKLYKASSTQSFQSRVRNVLQYPLSKLMYAVNYIQGKAGGKKPEGYSGEEDMLVYQRSDFDQPAMTYNLTDYGIGTVIKPIKSAKNLFNKNQIGKLFELQKEDGSWSLTEDLCSILGIHYDVCMEILVDAGIKSLAKRIQDEIMTLLATCITILLIIELESPDWITDCVQEDFWKNSLTKWLAESIEGGSQEVDEDHFPPHERMIKTVKYYHKKEIDCRWASTTLELGNSWGEVAAKMLGVA